MDNVVIVIAVLGVAMIACISIVAIRLGGIEFELTRIRKLLEHRKSWPHI